MAKEKELGIEQEGVILEALRGSKFRVKIGSSEHIAICALAGKLRKNFIRIVPGDKVKVELSAYDLSRGRITYREK